MSADGRPDGEAPRQGRVYVLTVRAVEEETPAEIRLRQWLKAGLRRYGLRCERVEPARGPRARDEARMREEGADVRE